MYNRYFQKFDSVTLIIPPLHTPKAIGISNIYFSSLLWRAHALVVITSKSIISFAFKYIALPSQAQDLLLYFHFEIISDDILKSLQKTPQKNSLQ